MSTLIDEEHNAVRPLPNTTIYVYKVTFRIESLSDVARKIGPYYIQNVTQSNARILMSEKHLKKILFQYKGYYLHKVSATRLTGKGLELYMEAQGQRRLL